MDRLVIEIWRTREQLLLAFNNRFTLYSDTKGCASLASIQEFDEAWCLDATRGDFITLYSKKAVKDSLLSLSGCGLNAVAPSEGSRKEISMYEVIAQDLERIQIESAELLGMLRGQPTSDLSSPHFTEWQDQGQPTVLNAAMYWFVSNRLARGFPSLIESQLVQFYQTFLPGEAGKSWRNLMVKNHHTAVAEHPIEATNDIESDGNDITLASVKDHRTRDAKTNSIVASLSTMSIKDSAILYRLLTLSFVSSKPHLVTADDAVLEQPALPGNVSAEPNYQEIEESVQAEQSLYKSPQGVTAADNASDSEDDESLSVSSGSLPENVKLLFRDLDSSDDDDNPVDYPVGNPVGSPVGNQACDDAERKLDVEEKSFQHQDQETSSANIMFDSHMLIEDRDAQGYDAGLEAYGQDVVDDYAGIQPNADALWAYYFGDLQDAGSEGGYDCCLHDNNDLSELL
eukprot:gene30845-37273_t